MYIYEAYITLHCIVYSVSSDCMATPLILTLLGCKHSLQDHVGTQEDPLWVSVNRLASGNSGEESMQ